MGTSYIDESLASYGDPESKRPFLPDTPKPSINSRFTIKNEQFACSRPLWSSRLIQFRCDNARTVINYIIIIIRVLYVLPNNSLNLDMKLFPPETSMYCFLHYDHCYGIIRPSMFAEIPARMRSQSPRSDISQLFLPYPLDSAFVTVLEFRVGCAPSASDS